MCLIGNAIGNSPGCWRFSGETYECTVVGVSFGNTLWHGSAFVCRGNKIVIQHRYFMSENGVAGDCKSGSIVAKSLMEQDGRYTSQLNVTFTALSVLMTTQIAQLQLDH